MKRPTGLPLLALSIGFLSFASDLAAQVAPRTKAATATRFRAIFEPVNYPQDLEITDVVFVNDSVGWASGAAATILYTGNGGKTWTPQLGGDPQGAERPIYDLRFVSASVGFATQGTGGEQRLLRTTDGQTWSETGTSGQHRGDIQFTSAESGVYVSGEKIFHTADAGKNWKTAYTCNIAVVVQGLSRSAKCHFEGVSFPTPQIGYAISRNVENAAFVVAKTTDAGSSWTAWTIPEPQLGGEHIVFTDENTGFIKMWGGAILSTRDGGKSWTGVPGVKLEGGKQARIKFVDREVGWGVSPYGTLVYTTDGGRRWASRKLKFPATINGFSVPSRGRGYVSGEHGMIYRYRIVPADYKASNIIEAPAISGGSVK